MNIKLIGSDTCPFVQRCLILLYISKKPFDFISIDLTKKPEWFLKISPIGKVPILEWDHEYIFESLIINEYLNEVLNLALQEKELLRKTKNKVYCEYSSTLMSLQYSLICSNDQVIFEKLIHQIKKGYGWLENVDIEYPFFNGNKINLIDVAFAPLFFRSKILKEIYNIDLLMGMPKLKQWSENILLSEYVTRSVPENYKNDVINNIIKVAGLVSQQLVV